MTWYCLVNIHCIVINIIHVTGQYLIMHALLLIILMFCDSAVVLRHILLSLSSAPRRCTRATPNPNSGITEYYRKHSG